MFANARDAFLRLFRRDMLSDLTAAIDARSPEPAVVTLVSIVFTTAPKTFTGSAVFVTGTVLPPIAQTPTGKASATDSSRMSSQTSSPSSSSPLPTTMATSPSLNQLAVTSTSSTATATAAPASNSGMSGGAKAGLAFGIILLLGLVGAFVLFMYKKRKDQNDEHQRLDDEKTFFAGGRNPDALPSHSAPSNGVATFDSEMQSIPPRDPAPQLSLRAVSQFEPSAAPQSTARVSALPPDAEAAAIAAATTAAVASATAAAASARTQQPASPAQTANNPENPFGNHAEQLGSSPPQEVPLPESPVDGAKAVEAADFPLPDTTPGTPKASSKTDAAAAGAAAIAAATAAAASNKPQGSATPTGGAGENVHRVQLDFAPSMEDELAVKAGETVRVLHEYDDGWALCMKMDRSRQGVVPRTCLSKHPVKPRPSSPARGNPRGPQGMRGPPPLGPPPFAQPPRPLTPGSGRNSPGPSSYGGRASPGPGGRMSPSPYQPSSSAVPRPLTPTGGPRTGPRNPAPYAQPGAGRSMSPGPYGGSRLRPQDGAAAAAGRNRSNSLGGVGASGANASATKLPGVSVSRKPVPSSSSVGSEILNA